MSSGTVAANGVELAYETFGDPAHPPVLLVTGLGAQMITWDQRLCERLARRGHHVVRFDNRDVGRSTHLHHAPRPDLAAIVSGDPSSAAYTLTDMADDTAGLLDALDLESVHVVGASMGGMIAQAFAIRYPGRVRSLTSIMSTTGAPEVGYATPAAQALLVAPPVPDRAAAQQRAVENNRIIGSPEHPADPDRIRELAGQAYDRGYDPAGAGRQLAGILASQDRTEALKELSIPALVVHGTADPLVHVSGGEATARAIPGAELYLIEGMGHDLAPGVWERVLDRIERVIRRGEHRR